MSIRWILLSAALAGAVSGCGADDDDSPVDTVGGSPDAGGVDAGGGAGDADSGGKDSVANAGAGATVDSGGYGAGAAGSAGDSSTAGAGGAGGAGHEEACGSLAILLDRSLSLAEKEVAPGVTRWAAAKSALLGFADELPLAQSWALKLVPDGAASSDACAPVAEGVGVPFAAESSSAVRDLVASAEPQGNGTPLPLAYQNLRSYLDSQLERHPGIVLLTDGAPNCAAAGEDRDAALAELLQSVETAASANIRTFVIGVGAETPSDRSVLTALARAGKTARLANPLSSEFYPGGSSAEIQAALADIAGRVASCEDEPFVEQPGYHALPLQTDFEAGGLEDFKITEDSWAPLVGESGVSIVAAAGAHSLSMTAPNAAERHAIAGGHEWSDAELRVKVRLKDDDSLAAIRLRYEANERSWVTLELSSSRFRVRERTANGGTLQVFEPETAPTIVAGVWYGITLRVQGAQVSVALDDVPLGSGALSEPTGNGGLGLGVIEGQVSYDDLSVVAP